MRGSAPAMKPTDVWHVAEDYTWGLDTALDNDNTYVTVHETAVGRGFLVSVMLLVSSAPAGTDFFMKITIDGGTPVEKEFTNMDQEPYSICLQAMAFFATSLKVEMKASDTVTAHFAVVTNIE